jgi:hypothetical protein
MEKKAKKEEKRLRKLDRNKTQPGEAAVGTTEGGAQQP